MDKPKVNGANGVISLILAIMGLLIFGLPLGIAAIVFGVIGYFKNEKYAVAGIIIGTIDFTFATFVIYANFLTIWLLNHA